MLQLVLFVIFCCSSAFANKPVLPVHYHITIIPDFKTFEAFIGITKIQILVQVEINELLLDQKNLNITELQLLNTKDEIVNIEWETDDSYVKIIPNSLLKGLYIIEIKYNAKITDNNEGFYTAKYTKNNEQKNILLTNLRFNKARQVFPCFDDPKFAATFSINIQRPHNYFSISNAAKKQEISINNGNLFEDQFAKSDMMPTYLVSIAIIDFDEHVSKENNVHVYSFTDTINVIQNIADLSNKYYNDFKQLFPYKLGQISHLIVPDNSISEDTVITFGIVMTRESSILTLDTKLAEEFIAFITIIAASICKQVMPYSDPDKWWQNYWLNEASSILMQFELLDSKISSLYEPLYHSTNYQSALENDIEHNSINITNITIESAQKVLKNPIFSSKAFALLRMTTKLNKPGSIFDNIVANTWANKTGYPILEVENQPHNLLLTQKTATQSDDVIIATPWSIPVNIIAQNEDMSKPPTIVAINTGSTNFSYDTDSSWFIINSNQIGYYRVNYELENWNRITDHLKKGFVSTISSLTRSQLIEDAFYLSNLLKLSPNVYLDLISYIDLEESFNPLMSFFKTASQFRFMLAEMPSIQQKFVEYVINVSKHLYEKYYTNFSENNHIQILTRNNIVKWLCNFGYDQCRTEMHKLMITDNVVAEIKDFVYCGGMYLGNLEHFAHVFKQVDSTHKLKILRAMGCTNKITILENYLDSLIDNSELLTLKSTDKLEAFHAILEGSTNGADVALLSLKTNLKKFTETFSIDEFEDIMNALSKKLITKKQQDFVLDLRLCILALDNEQKDEFIRIIDNALKTIKFNQNWINTYKSDIEEWFESNISSSIGTTTTSIPILNSTSSGIENTTNPASTTIQGSDGTSVKCINYLLLIVVFCLHI